jgi:hypothetical protein
VNVQPAHRRVFARIGQVPTLARHLDPAVRVSWAAQSVSKLNQKMNTARDSGEPTKTVQPSRTGSSGTPTRGAGAHPLKALAAGIPLGRPGTSDEIAKAAVFLSRSMAVGGSSMKVCRRTLRAVTDRGGARACRSSQTGRRRPDRFLKRQEGA